MSPHPTIENTLMNNFETESRSVLLNYRASLNNNFDTNEESLEKAITALTQLHQQEMLRVIGEDEKPKPNLKSNDIHEKFGTCWSCCEQDYCTHEIRDELRAEQRTNLNKEANND